MIFFKRPAVLYAALFAAGIAAERLRPCVVMGAFLAFYMAGFWMLGRLRKGKRKVSSGDRLLFAAPVCFLFGFLLMCGRRMEYNNQALQLEKSMGDGREILARGTVTHIRETKNGFAFELEQAETGPDSPEGEYQKAGTLLVYTDSLAAENGTIKDGQQVLLHGKGRGTKAAGTPGEFDAAQYYFSLGITGTLSADTMRITNFSYHRLNQAFFLAKNKLMERYPAYLGEEDAGVVSSMLLGERALLSEDTKELYRRGGISHILAISGLHVSLLGMAVYRLLRRTVLGRNGAIPAACACVVLYGRFTEAGTSTKRAVLMFFLLLLATALGRSYDTLSAMAVSAVVILCRSPGALYTASFQLSFAAAYGASVLPALLVGRKEERPQKEMALSAAGQTEGRLKRRMLSLKEKGKRTVLFGVAIQLITFPVTVVHYFEYPFYGFFLNPFIVPLMSLLLFCALFSGICGMFSAGLGYFFAGGARAILWFYKSACTLASRLPFSLLLFGKPALWQMALYFSVLAGGVFLLQKMREKGKQDKERQKRRWIFIVFIFLPMILLPVPSGAFEAAFLDMGQGDGIVLRSSGAVLTVDGGSSDVQSVGSRRLIPYLKAKGIRVIDCAIISHADNDHISGICEILAAMPPYSPYRASGAGYTGEILIKSIALPQLAKPDAAYQALVESAGEKKVEILYLSAGDCLLPGKGLSLTCLAPEERAAFSGRNASSLVLLASYGEFDLLLTGDIDAAEEEKLLARAELRERSVEVLKVAHHGSSGSSCKEFLTGLRPVCSVISCGRNNRYGHPHKEALEILSETSGKVLRTDETGCITVRVRRQGYRVYGGAKERLLCYGTLGEE